MEKKPTNIKRILKMNFLPIILVIYVVIIIVGAMLFGGIDLGSGGGTSGNVKSMTAKGFFLDMYIDTDWSTYLTIEFKSLDHGDTLVIIDTISDIEYNSSVDATKITFEYVLDGGGTGSVHYWFNGDISNSYNVEDRVKITVTIKHVTFTNENMDYDMEIFKEHWVSQEYYIENSGGILEGFKAMAQSRIVKI